jgi:hypothetical protein
MVRVTDHSRRAMNMPPGFRPLYLTSTAARRALFAVCALAALRLSGLTGSQAAGQPFTFDDVTSRAGISFVHENGAAGAYWYPELFGGGVAVIDADGDRWPDLLFVNGRRWTAGVRASHALFHNNRNGTFTNVTSGSGFDALDVYGLGAAVGDFDNDGRDDVFVTTTEGGRLMRNTGANKFVDVTSRAGIRAGTFAVSAAWLDYDKDGLLDLFVGNYVQWSPAIETQVRCTQNGVRGYCGPDAYKPVAPKLYHNLGGGRFEDATTRAGMDDPSDKVMGVAVLDYNGDGWPDLFVGSDRVPAKLYRNDGKGHFVDEAVRAGVALSENGVARANMGTDAADYDRSGRPHIVVGNFVNEMLGLYHNENGSLFRDVAPRSEVGRASLLAVTWATFFFDADLDGFPDIFTANGGTDESQGPRCSCADQPGSSALAQPRERHFREHHIVARPGIQQGRDGTRRCVPGFRRRWRPRHRHDDARRTGSALQERQCRVEQVASGPGRRHEVEPQRDRGDRARHQRVRVAVADGPQRIELR